MRITRRGTWTPEDRARSVYHYLPFEVTARVDAVRFELSYDESAGVLDLGCIDPLGWCGWSGGSKRQVTIARDVATPGYLPRGVPAGEWRIVLGLHRVPLEGIAWEVRVETGYRPVPVPPAPPVPARPLGRELPREEGLVWLAGDLHAHTVHSDGELSIDALAALAVGRGLDFLAVTDHNTVSHHRSLPDAARRAGIVLVPGQELTTADGHANVFGDTGWVDFRRPAVQWAEDVTRRGGLLSVNHPVSGDCAWRHPLPSPPPLAEIWHSSWRDRRDGAPLAWWNAHHQHPVPVGGSDWHGPASGALPGSPTTWVACADDDILGGLRAGRTAISNDRDGPVLLRVGDELVAVGADGAQLVCPEGRRTPVRGERARFAGHPRPHVLETNDRAVLSIAA